MKKFKLFSFKRKFLSVPYAVFMAVFILLPLLILLLYSFTESQSDGSLIFKFTLDNYKAIFSSSNTTMLVRSLYVGLITTGICLVIGYPVAYFINNSKYNKSSTLIMLFILPMWINFLLRTLATKAIFESLNISLGMGTVVFGMVYNYLPFMIMPISTTIQKIDKSLLEGASDLGASPSKAFWKVTFPLSLPGILSGITMVFTPTITTFAISGLLSDNRIGLIGDYIDMQVKSSLNIASAMSFLILIIIGISMLVVNRYDKDSSTSGGGLW